MPVDTREILDLLSRLSNEEEMRVTFTQAGRAAVITGASVGAGALIFGPVGVIVGAVCGSLLAVSTGRPYKSVYQVIKDMDPVKKEVLANKVRHIMNNFEVSDAVVFAGMLSSNLALRRQVVDELLGFLRQEMQMQIVNG